MKVSLGREIWNIVDVAWAGLLIYSMFVKNKKMEVEEENKSDVQAPNIENNSETELFFMDKDNTNEKEFLSFHFNRLFYEKPEKIVELYNNEVEIGLTGEKLQILYLLVLNKLFIKHFYKSPIVIVDNNTIDIKGKIYLTKNSFEYEDKNNLRVIRK